jgi:hypothetical protein
MYKWIDGKLTITKDPDAVLDYGIDLVDWLNNGDALDSVSGIELGITASNTRVDGTQVLSQISGGAVGEDASFTFRFVTTSGLIDDRTIYFNIQER